MSYRSPREVLEALKDWGVDVRAYEPDGRPWYSHTTNGGWNPWGTAHHHTAGTKRLLTSRLSQRAMLRILRNGYAGLPGPLCHGAPSVDPNTGKGVLWLVGWGNVNHAGLVDATNLAQVRAGKYAGRNPRSDSADGNSHLYGWEYMHPGDGTPWPDELLQVGHLASCAVADAHGWSAHAVGGSQIEHKQLTRRKIDRSWRGNVQQAVQDAYDAGPGGETMANPRDVWQVGIGGGDRKARASLYLIWAARRAGDAKRLSRQGRDAARAAHKDAQAARQDVADLRVELPEIVEQAAARGAARGARKALSDSTVQVDVNVTGGDAA